MPRVPRVRMFAGPNGSGKSCLKGYVNAKWIGIFINADEIEKQMLSQEGLRLQDYKLTWADNKVIAELSNHDFAKQLDLSQVHLKDGVFKMPPDRLSSYYASALATVMRDCLMEHQISFSFETVMSHESKVQFLSKAKSLGYRTYLYYIATSDPDINIARVALRVNSGGHDVPKEKVTSRYFKSLALLKPALKQVNRGFIFDNSGKESVCLAETEETKAGNSITAKVKEYPQWLHNALDL